MTPETRSFLARVRDAEGPAAGVEQRVLEAVRASVAQPAAASTLGAKAVLKLAAWIAGAAVLGVALEPAARVPHVRAPVEVRAPLEAARQELQRFEANVPSLTPERPVPERARRRERAAPNLQAELAFLAEVHAALRRGDGAEALRRLDAHRTGDRQLAVERRAARVFALCAVGRVAEARTAAAEFVRRSARAPQRAAVERACAGD
ncbi:MAG TPA: hypothetical protein VJR89_36850 [Polyangiales bacterium]|nr:hypothetical protein [Polyangiales bacterium]